MLCDKCQKNQANIHMHQYVNGEKKEINLCPACSFSMIDMPISFENLFQGVMDSLLNMKTSLNTKTGKKSATAITIPSLKCPICKMTSENFKSGGKLGCYNCYRTFASELAPLIKNVQGGVRHEGKLPKRSGVEYKQIRETDRLREMLKKAVNEENFEEAASLRDQIRAITNAEAAETGDNIK